MKTLLTMLCVSFVFCSAALSQTLEGTYTNTWENSAGSSLTYTLTLKTDGTFLFESYRIYEDADPSEKVLVNGTWRQDHRLLTLNTDASAENDELSNNLNSVRARFEDYPPRHVLHGKIQPSLKFYQSGVFYAKDMKLEKKPVDMVASPMKSDVRTVVQNENQN